MTLSGSMARLLGLIREHQSFFIPYVLLLALAGGALMTLDQGDSIFFLNGNRTPFWDTFFIYGTMLGEGLVFALATIVLLWVGFRYALMLPFLGLMVSVVTQTTKRWFDHPRPFAYFRAFNLEDYIEPIEGVDIYTGMNSFPSGHTMAAFALFTYLALCTPRKRISGLLFFALATIVAVSRIYLVHHFLKDVYLGSLLGVILALAVFMIAEYLPEERYPWLDRTLSFTSPSR